MYYVYVDPVSGSDTPTGARKNTNAATAAASPWQTLAVALAQEATNLTTLGDDVTFRLLAGQENIATSLGPTETQYPGADYSSSYGLIFEGYGAGEHDGAMATTNGYTLGRSSGFGNLMTPENVNCTYRNFRLRNNYGGDAVSLSGAGYSRQAFDQMLLFSIDGRAARLAGGNNTTRRHTMLNSVCVSRDYLAVQINGNDDGTLIRHCTIFNDHATELALQVNANAELRYNYVANIGAGDAMGGANLATSTVDQNATNDTTGTSGMQGIAAATGSGAEFTSLTSAAENFDIAATSDLVDIATNSGITIDILGRARSTPDAGAFEYQSGSSLTITDVDTDEVIQAGQTNIVVTGTGFGASQGAGNVRIIQGSVDKLQPNIDSWGDTSVQFDLTFDS